MTAARAADGGRLAPLEAYLPPRAAQHASRQALIDAANAEMCAAKTAAFAAYGRVHPVGHVRCADACRDAHRVLCDRLSDINAAYQAAIPRLD